MALKVASELPTYRIAKSNKDRVLLTSGMAIIQPLLQICSQLSNYCLIGCNLSYNLSFAQHLVISYSLAQSVEARCFFNATSIQYIVDLSQIILILSIDILLMIQSWILPKASSCVEILRLSSLYAWYSNSYISLLFAVS